MHAPGILDFTHHAAASRSNDSFVAGSRQRGGDFHRSALHTAGDKRGNYLQHGKGIFWLR